MLPENQEGSTWEYDMDEGGLAVQTPPPEKQKPSPPPQEGRVSSPMKTVLRRTGKEILRPPKTFVVDRVKAAAQAQEAMRESRVLQKEAQIVATRLQKLSITPQGHEALVRRATVDSIRKESTLGAVRREMATVTTPQEKVRAQERVQRAAMARAATVKSERKESTLGAVRREMQPVRAPKAQEQDIPLLTELFDDDEHIPEVKPLGEPKVSKPSFEIEPEPTIQYTKSEEPKGIWHKTKAWVKSWW